MKRYKLWMVSGILSLKASPRNRKERKTVLLASDEFPSATLATNALLYNWSVQEGWKVELRSITEFSAPAVNLLDELKVVVP